MHFARGVVLAALVLFAGCGGGPGTGTQTLESTSTATRTPTATAADVSIDAVTLPSGATTSGIDADQLLAAHDRELRESGRFRMVANATLSGPDQTLSFEQRLVFDGTNGRLYRVATDGDRRTITYREGKSEFVRVESPDGEPTYRSSHRPPVSYDGKTHAGTDQIRGGLAAFDWNATGATVRGDTGFVHYEAVAVRNLSALGSYQGSVESTSGTLVVSESGVVRRLDYSLTIATDDGETTETFSYRVSAVGNARVPRPGWLSEVVTPTE